MAKRRFKPCSRCGRRLRSVSSAHDWNVILESGRIIGLICPDCQTAEENAEAAVNEATLDYGVRGGRIIGRPKSGI